MRRNAVPFLAIALLAPCPPLGAQQGAVPGLPPAGYGTLRQEDIALRLETPTLAVRIIPLDEAVTRLLSPDSYAALHRLRSTWEEEIRRAGARYGSTTPTPFLVTFFGRQDRARFDPEILTITSQNRFYRPLEILPLGPQWGGRQLNQRETASAIYVFEDGIRLVDPLTVAYAATVNDEWAARIPRLDRERASVLARAASERRP